MLIRKLQEIKTTMFQSNDFNRLLSDTGTGNFLVFNNGAKKNILFIGSCRSVSMIAYFQCEINIRSSYNIYFIGLPWISGWDNKTGSYGKAINLLSTTTMDWIITEYVSNFGLLNSERDNTKCRNRKGETTGENIYQLITCNNIIMVPSVDCFIYLSTVLSTNSNLLAQFKSQKGLLTYDSEIVQDTYKYIDSNVEKFIHNCRNTSIPEIADYFQSNMRGVRLLITFNHPSTIFLYEMARFVLGKYFNIEISANVKEHVKRLRLIQDQENPICEWDVLRHNFTYTKGISIDELLNVPNSLRPTR